MAGAYTIPNVAFNSYVVWTNHVPSTAMRGFGVTSASFAIETHLDRIADVLGIDPWELRLKNAARVGDLTPTRVRLTDPSAVATMKAAAEAAGVALAAPYDSMSNHRGADEVPDHLRHAVAADEVGV
jgi:CO/xanthine dehydrogenase Mo-binding subunit